MVSAADATVDQGAAGKGGSGEHEAPSRPKDAGVEPLEGGIPAQDAPSTPDVAVDAAPDGPADVMVPTPGCPTGWACLPAGSFTMGSAANEPGREANETAHLVTITQPFWMKATEVTQGEWQALMGDNPSNYQQCGSSCPVENIDWYQAIVFANAASLRDGYSPCYQTAGGGTYDDAAVDEGEIPILVAGLACPGYRLPTEAEWEYAARAGTSTAFHSGPITRATDCNALEPALNEIGWYCANRSADTHPVGRKKPNAWGLYDMHGNVWEWLWDRGSQDADYPAGPATDPLGPETGSLRRDRGGAYHNNPAQCRAANRDAVSPDESFVDTGLRLVRSAL